MGSKDESKRDAHHRIYLSLPYRAVPCRAVMCSAAAAAATVCCESVVRRHCSVHRSVLLTTPGFFFFFYLDWLSLSLLSTVNGRRAGRRVVGFDCCRGGSLTDLCWRVFAVSAFASSRKRGTGLGEVPEF